MIDFSTVTNITLGSTPVEQIADSLGNVLWSAIPPVVLPNYFYVEDISGSDNTLSIVKYDASAPTIEVFKSTDQENWVSMGTTSETAITATVPANGKVYLKATTNTWSDGSNYYNYISCTGNHNVGGNIMSLLYGDNYQNQTSFPNGSTYNFQNLFNYNTTLVNAEDLLLPATTLADSCYAAMFLNCTSLTQAPTLPATTLTNECYYCMFYGCTALTTAPALPATTLEQSCYRSMFYNCTSLTTAPALPATTLADSCYAAMFAFCTSLTQAPTLPATTLANYCYESMFQNCTSLTIAPTLPATTLASYCYRFMFQNCTSLTTAPALPATTLADSCYNSMFYGCTSLTAAPALPATTLAQYCYYQMFRSCSNLATVTTYASNISASNCLTNWLNGVSATGDFYNLGGATYPSGISGIPTGWAVHKQSFYIEDISGSANTLSISSNSSTNIEVFKLTDNGWSSMGTISTTPITATIPANSKLYLKANTTDWNGCNITATGNHNVGGNILQLLYGDAYTGNVFADTTITYIFSGLFANDTHLVSAEDLVLPTNVTPNCYYSTFQNCTGLTTSPALPATTLANNCYAGMFMGCTALTTAPELPAITLVDGCYSAMFAGCTSLNEILTYAQDISATGCLSTWVYNVAASGDFYNGGGATYTTGANGIPTGWTEHIEQPNYFYVEDTSGSSNTLSIKKRNSNDPTIEVFYSTDQQTWTSIGTTSTTAKTATVPANGKLYLKCDTERWGSSSSSSYGNAITCSGNFNVGGNIMSLLYGDSYNFKTKLKSPSSFTSLFYYTTTNDKLINADDLLLPATTLTDYCYAYMFRGCTSLTTAPALPVTTLAQYCYYQMFQNCTALTTAPELPATTLADSCYNNMFYGCTALTTAPALPVTTLAQYCYYQMFYGCTSLTTAPALPATTLANYCYYSMFYNCTSLTTTPALSATTLASGCYRYMFEGCTGLTTAPVLPATTLTNGCYYGMFYGCTALTTAPALPATTLEQSCYREMFLNCRALTTAPELPATTLEQSCYREMFDGCTGLTTAPVLPATTLAQECYRQMFYGCTSLTTAPALPATTLAKSCYYYMFKGCSNLATVTTYAQDISASSCLTNWLNNVAASGDFYNLGGATYPSGTSGIPTGWTEHTTL